MFDGICILISLLLFSKARVEYRDVSFLVLCFFVITEACYQHFFLEFRAANNWFIYLLYSLIYIPIIHKLKKSNAHLVIIDAIRVNVLLNIVVSFYFIGDTVPKLIYDVYPYLAGLIMIICLIYQWMWSYGTRFIDSFSNNKNIITRILRLRYGV